MRGVPWPAEELVASQEALWPSAAYTVVAALWAVQQSMDGSTPCSVDQDRNGGERKSRTAMTNRKNTQNTLWNRDKTSGHARDTAVWHRNSRDDWGQVYQVKAQDGGQRVLCPSLLAPLPITLTLCNSYSSFSLLPVYQTTTWRQGPESQFPSQSTNSPHFMRPTSSLPFSQHPVIKH